jgi:hypothetical protein
MERNLINTIVILNDGRKGLITDGSYLRNGRVSNWWEGVVLDKNGNALNEKFHGYDNGQSWKRFTGSYKVSITYKVEF